MDTSGFDELQRRLRKLDDSHGVPMIELPDPEFMTKHARFSSFQDMLDHSGTENHFNHVAAHHKPYPLPHG